MLYKSYTEAYEILERIANNNYQWPSTRQPPARGVAGVQNIDAITALSAQVTSLTNMVKAMTFAPAAVKQVAELSCAYCGEEYDFDNYLGNPAAVNDVGNFNRQLQNNAYSNNTTLDGNNIQFSYGTIKSKCSNIEWTERKYSTTCFSSAELRVKTHQS